MISTSFLFPGDIQAPTPPLTGALSPGYDSPPMIPDWLTTTLAALPPLLWVMIGLGVPWALAILPRRDWTDRALVMCLALALGPALLTAWMFILGTAGMGGVPSPLDTSNPMQGYAPNHTSGTALLTPARILSGTLVMALAGIALAWRKARRTVPVPPDASPLHFDERLLIALIIAATAGRWLLTAFLHFGSWDELWVYGYQGRLYTLIGYIPADIGYYPQFLPLQYAFTQILRGGIDDHAARAVIPFLQIGSILATYVLGSRLINRRAGIIAAALWALYPHFGYWTRVGDLETPLTFAFTGAAAFFLMAWTAADRALRRRYAFIAGLFFGVAMWTKPTAGAFVWGVVLVVGVGALLAAWKARRGGKGSLAALVADFWPRVEVAVITGLACIPLGGLWYARNIILGHKAIVFPPGFWLTQAERSGAEFGWPLLAVGLLLVVLYWGAAGERPPVRWIAPGALLIALGIVPSIVTPHRMTLPEWAALLAGALLLSAALWRYARSRLTPTGHRDIARIGWALLLALPYFITWFYSYSYHYRLSFPIVPLMILPSAVVLARWLSVDRIRAWTAPRRLGYAALIVAVSAWGVAIPAYDETIGWDLLPSFFREDASEGSALDRTVRLLQGYIDTHDAAPVIVAPGAQRLPFYFPLLDIRVTGTPRSFDAFTGVTHFIDGADAIFTYSHDGSDAPFQNQFLAGIRRPNVATRAGFFEDTSFFYEVFELHLDRRFDAPPVALTPAQDIIFGGFARLAGYSVSDTRLDGGVTLELIWQGVTPTPVDYSVYVHLYTGDGIVPDDFAGGLGDGPVGVWRSGYYATPFWEPGEYIIDRRTLHLPPEVGPGDAYRVRIGFYNVSDQQRAPVTIGGAAAGDGYTLDVLFQVGE